MIAKVLSSAVLGIDAYIAEIEADISSSRALISITYPSNFMLVAAMNPCPYGSQPQTNRNFEAHLPDLQISGEDLRAVDKTA